MSTPATASHILAAKGRACTLRTTTKLPGPNSSTAGATVAAFRPCRGFIRAYRAREINGTDVLSGDMMAVLEPMAFMPKKGDKFYPGAIVAAGDAATPWMQVVSTPRLAYVADQLAVIRLHLRA
jgi:hypothetical protein